VFRDEALARFMERQAAMQYAYEERVSALRATQTRSGSGEGSEDGGRVKAGRSGRGESIGAVR
jgi:hypothetical protein